MPDIPYKPVPTVSPEEARRTAAIPSIHENFPHVQLTTAIGGALEQAGAVQRQYGATMSTVADSMHSLGRVLGDVGDKMWTSAVGLKQLESEKNVNDATIAYEQDQMKRDEAFKQLEGNAADSNALAAHMKASEDARQKVKAGMSMYEQKLFDAQTTRQYLISMRAAGGHVATETKNAAYASFEARVNSTVSQMSQAKEDKDYEVGAATIQGIIKDHLQPLRGWSDDVAKEKYHEVMQKAFAGRMEVLSETDPGRAMTLLEANKDNMDGATYARLYNTIRGQKIEQGSNHIANQVQQEMPNASLEEKLKRGDEIAERDAAGDEKYQAAERRKVETQHNVGIKEDNEARQKAENTALAIARARNSEGGKRPVSLAEARVQPGFNEAYALLNEHQRGELDKIFLSNSKEDYPDTPQTKAIYRKYDGEMLDYPTAMLDRMRQNPSFIDSLQMPEKFRDVLYNRYRELVKQGKAAEADSKVGRAYAKGVQNGMIGRTVDKNDNNRQHFKSYLGERLRAEEEVKKGPLDEKETIKVIDDALSWHKEQGDWFQHQRYKTLTEPTSQYETWYSGQHPGAGKEEIQRAYARAKVKELLEKEEKTGPKIVPSIRVRTTPGTP
jgi:hypothetical protein